MPVDADGVPVAGLEPLHLIDGIGQRQGTVDRDVIFVMKDDQPVQLEMACDRDGFLADALHQIPVGDKDIGVVIDDIAKLGIQHAFGERHANRGRKALAKRSRGRLDASGMMVFGVARRYRS